MAKLNDESLKLIDTIYVDDTWKNNGINIMGQQIPENRTLINFIESGGSEISWALTPQPYLPVISDVRSGYIKSPWIVSDKLKFKSYNSPFSHDK